MSSLESRDLLEQLLAEEATQGLSALETLELERLLDELGTDRAECGYEHAAAALEVAFHAVQSSGIKTSVGQSSEAQSPQMPASVQEGLVDLAARASRGDNLLAFPTAAAEPEPTHESSSKTALWLLAAAAAIVLLGIAPRFFDREGTAPLPSEELVVAAADHLTLDFSATEDAAAAGASGQVLWSTSSQTGEMRISGLEANDPAVSQYQLWIFDAEQDERYPIDGGVFDVGSDEVVVAIDAKIDVRSPTLFAITVEKPGGVVVSDRERIVLVASAA